MMQEQADEPLSLTATAAEANISMQTLRRMMNAGTGPETYRLGRCRMVRRADALAFVERSRSARHG